MMRFVVDDDDVLKAHQLLGHAPDHLALGLLGGYRLVAALEQRAPDLVNLKHLPQLKAMVICNDDLGLADIVEHIAGHQLARPVVVFQIAR